MEMLENYMVMPRAMRKTQKDLEDYENYLLEEQDRTYEEKITEELLDE